MRRETAFSPESAAGSSKARSYRSPFSTSSRRGADRKWGFGASYGSNVREETGRLSPPESVTGFSIKFIGNWIMSADLGLLDLTQNNCSLNSLL